MLYLAQQPRVESPEAQRALHAADGYLFLGLHKEAMSELNRVPLMAQGDPAVLLTRVRVLLHRRNWREAEELASRCVEAFPEVERMVEDIYTFVSTWLPEYRGDNRNYLTIAIGCTGGRHRSVYIVERLRAMMATAHPLVRHRELH